MGILHNDIKPENLCGQKNSRLGPTLQNMQIFLIDFGLSIQYKQNNDEATKGSKNEIEEELAKENEEIRMLSQNINEKPTPLSKIIGPGTLDFSAIALQKKYFGIFYEAERNMLEKYRSENMNKYPDKIPRLCDLYHLAFEDDVESLVYTFAELFIGEECLPWTQIPIGAKTIKKSELRNIMRSKIVSATKKVCDPDYCPPCLEKIFKMTRERQQKHDRTKEPKYDPDFYEIMDSMIQKDIDRYFTTK